MTSISHSPVSTDADQKQYCPYVPQKPMENSEIGGHVVGAKPNFENGYVTMNEEGLAIAMIPKQV